MPSKSSIGLFAKLLPLAILIVTAAGCVTANRTSTGNASIESIDNHFTLFEKIPPQIRRVALLPITHEAENWQASSSMSHLDPLFLTELNKLNRFEIVAVSHEQLDVWTEDRFLRASDTLPVKVIVKLQQDQGCDAVLFAHLHTYHPYTPLIVGWKLHLIDLRLQSVLWAADVTYDASEEPIAQLAKYYATKTYKTDRGARDPERILLSPRRFSQFTLASLFGSLPSR